MIQTMRYNIIRLIMAVAMLCPLSVQADQSTFKVKPAPRQPITSPRLEPVIPVIRATQAVSPERELRPAVTRPDISYENTTLTEDTTWRGTVLIRGYLVIAPQATVRIEPGTVVRFTRSAILRQLPRLVIMGRIHANGTQERPVLFAPNLPEAEKGDWGGILLLASEKRNQLDHVRIEGAETAIEARFSTLGVKGAAISRAGTGLLLRDSTVTLAATGVSGCLTGLEIHDSEVDLREVTLVDNQRGMAAYHSGLTLASVKVAGSRQGMLAEECRLKLTSCEFSGNSVGALLKGGEGQVFMTRFTRNREIGLHLIGVRLKVQRSLIADNAGDGLRVEDGRALVWASAFSGNGGYHLANTGGEAVSAVLNWWGSSDEAAIAAKLSNGKNARSGQVAISPWLTERPSALP